MSTQDTGCETLEISRFDSTDLANQISQETNHAESAGQVTDFPLYYDNIELTLKVCNQEKNLIRT